MRSSAALLIAAALTASAVPLPVKVEENLITPKVTVRAPQPVNVFKHRHYDAVKREAKEKRAEVRAREVLNSYQHRHYHAAVARDEGDRHRHHGHGHWTESGTWVHTGTSFPAGTGAPSQTDAATTSSAAPTVSANTATGFPGGKNCHTSSTEAPSETSPPTDPTSTIIEVTSTVIVTEPTSTEVSTPPVVTESSSTESVPSTTQAPSTTVAPATTQAPTTTSATTTNPNADAYLQPHNDARAAHSANPVTWSDELAAMAQTWVNNCNFEHSGGSLASFGYGENLAAGTGPYAISDAVASWVNEGQNYNANDPTNESTLHFTQVVWKATTEIGCAYADCPAGSGPFDASYGSWRLHSCEYTPQGNVIGSFADNVS